MRYAATDRFEPIISVSVYDVDVWFEEKFLKRVQKYLSGIYHLLPVQSEQHVRSLKSPQFCVDRISEAKVRVGTCH